MKYLKYKHQSIFFPCGGGSNLILGTGMKSHIFILRTLAAVKYFFTGLSKNDFGIILKTLIYVINCKLCKLGSGDTSCDAPIMLDAPHDGGPIW